MAVLMIEANKEAWEFLVKGISDEVAKVLKNPPERPEEANALVAFVNTLRGITDTVLGYLPPGERKEIKDVCGTFMDIGLLFGKSPRILVDILEKSGAKVVRAKD